MAVQLAKHLGAHTTTVSGTKGVAVSSEFGADVALDYMRGPIRFANKFDVIVDFSGKFPFTMARPHLTPRGRYVDSSPSIPKFIGSMLGNLVRSQKQLMLAAEPRRADLEFLAALVESGQLQMKVAKVFPLASIQEAFAEQEAGGVIGKIIVSVEST